MKKYNYLILCEALVVRIRIQEKDQTQFVKCLPFLSFFYLFNSCLVRIVDLQCYVSFRCTARVSVIHIHISPLFQIPFQYRPFQSTEQSVLCDYSRPLLSFLICSSMYMSIPVSQFIPPSSLEIVILIEASRTEKQIPYNIAYIWNLKKWYK